MTSTVTFPPLLASDDALLEMTKRVAAQSLDEELAIIVDEIRADPAFPRDLGALKGELKAVPAVDEGHGSIVAYIVAAGAANAYAAVIDIGRTPGRAAPPISKIKAWVLRKMPERVSELAQELQAAYAQEHPGTKIIDVKRGNTAIERAGRNRTKLGSSVNNRSGKASRAIGVYEDRAAFLLARAISRSIAAKGIEGRNFVNGKRQMIEDRVRARVTNDLNETFAQLGWTR